MGKGQYPEIVAEVVKMKLSPKSAVKEIEELEKNSMLGINSFKLPVTNSENVICSQWI